MAHQVVRRREPGGLHDALDRRANVTDVVPDPRRVDARLQRRLRHVHQPLRRRVDRTHGTVTAASV